MFSRSSELVASASMYSRRRWSAVTTPKAPFSGRNRASYLQMEALVNGEGPPGGSPTSPLPPSLARHVREEATMLVGLDGPDDRNSSAIPVSCFVRQKKTKKNMMKN
jgi:hypothetical protein